MARRGENIYKRKDGRWEGRYKNGFKTGGKTRYSSVYGKSYSEVRTALLQKKQSANENRMHCKCSFGEVVQMWLNSIKNTVKESTYSNYIMKIKKHILPKLGKVYYEKLTADVLNAFVSYKLATGLSAKYVSDISVLIKSVCKFAHRQYGYTDKAKFMVLPKQEKRSDKRMFTAQEQDSLNTWFSQNITPCNAGIMLSAATGIRIGELCALKWSDFDLEKSIFTVSKTMQRIKNHETSGTKVIITLPKSRTSVQEIPIPEFMKSALQQLKCDSDCFFLTGKPIFY